MPPTTIREKIEDIQRQIPANPGLGLDLKELAVEAIYDGFGSEAWNYFMSKFQFTPLQLQRMTTTSTDCHDYNKPARAYLVGNATCLPGTYTTLTQGISDFLDVTLPGVDAVTASTNKRSPVARKSSSAKKTHKSSSRKRTK